jgi:hypothetical protein
MKAEQVQPTVRLNMPRVFGIAPMFLPNKETFINYLIYYLINLKFIFTYKIHRQQAKNNLSGGRIYKNSSYEPLAKSFIVPAGFIQNRLQFLPNELTFLTKKLENSPNTSLFKYKIAKIYAIALMFVPWRLGFCQSRLDCCQSRFTIPLISVETERNRASRS